MKKSCKECGEIKDIGWFYRAGNIDGRSNECKICARARVKAREIKRKEDPEWLAKERARGREKYHRLYKGKGWNGTNEAKAAWIVRNSIKRSAHNLARNALRSGQL
ncbi:unnamed protein product, partial [marine sediment metagenome]